MGGAEDTLKLAAVWKTHCFKGSNVGGQFTTGIACADVEKQVSGACFIESLLQAGRLLRSHFI